jgi:ABC-type antimicrobial peptide transport system permease subunit
MTSNGEISTIKMLCVIIGVVSLLVGSLRFLLKAQAGGIPFLLAALAFIPVYRLTEWFLLAVVAACAGVIVGWLPGMKQR